MISGHGNNLYHFEAEAIRADFSSNIAFNNQSQRILEHLKGQMHLIQNYPDPETKELRQALAQHHGISPQQILVTNGSAEAFYLIAHYLARQAGSPIKSLILTPSFAEYEDSCKLHQHELDFRDISEFAQLELSRYQSLWLGCPNNPDGRRISKADIKALSAQYPHCHFVLDCAYEELCTEEVEENTGELAPNHIITHSLTKSFGIPGIRLGYIIAESPIIASLEEMRAPWTVNALSLAAADFILRHYKELLFSRSELMGESQWLQSAMSGIEGLHVEPSCCNFFLCQVVDGRNSEELQAYLIREHGLLIRHAGNFRGLSPNHFRLAAQSREKNQALIHALRQWSSLTH